MLAVRRNPEYIWREHPHAPIAAASRPQARLSRLNELPMAMSQPPSDALPAVATRAGWASLKDLTGYQWFVFIVCCLAWDMDCLDQQLFNLARRPAMQDLVPAVSTDDPRVPEHTRKLTEQSAVDNKPAPTAQQV